MEDGRPGEGLGCVGGRGAHPGFVLRLPGADLPHRETTGIAVDEVVVVGGEKDEVVVAVEAGWGPPGIAAGARRGARDDMGGFAEADRVLTGGFEHEVLPAVRMRAHPGGPGP